MNKKITITEASNGYIFIESDPLKGQPITSIVTHLDDLIHMIRISLNTKEIK